MAELRRLSGEQTIKVLTKLGFVKTRQRGSHVILKKKTRDGSVGCVVPMHKELAVGTLRGILRQAKLTPEEFMEIIK